MSQPLRKWAWGRTVWVQAPVTRRYYTILFRIQVEAPYMLKTHMHSDLAAAQEIDSKVATGTCEVPALREFTPGTAGRSK